MKRILITGGNGFIAKHIILQLLQKDKINGKDLGFFFLKIELAGG